MNPTYLLLALGSNTLPDYHIEKAKRLLTQLYPNISFTSVIQTAPVGATTDDVPPYLNCLAWAYTDMTYQQVMAETKNIEQRLGRVRDEAHHHVIPIDIDIMQYGDSHYHETDWEHDYIQRLLPEVETKA